MSKTKSIAVIGGGISGLSVLHYLHKKYSNRPDIQIRLYEKMPHLGGTVATANLNGCLIENGPNGFLDNQQNTFEFLSQLGLMDQVIPAGTQSQVRYLRLGHHLHRFPLNPLELLAFKPLSIQERLRFFGEVFCPKKEPGLETVYEFALRRFGKRTAELLFDCVVSGIYAGDIYQLNMQEAFPQVVDMEQTHGSVIKGLLARKGKKRPRMHSLRNGMGQVIDALAKQYASLIQTSCEISSIHLTQGRFILSADHTRIEADEIFLALPANKAAAIVNPCAPILSGYLDSIEYAPISVVGLVYRKSDFQNVPTGFGYLMPSIEGQPVLGVLVESNVFEGRSPQDLVTIRVMIGGARHREVSFKAGTELYDMAHKAVTAVWPNSQAPVHMTLLQWPKAIPQYTQSYAALKPKITSELKQFPRLHITANYWNGVSFNDCIKNARTAVENVNL